MKDKLIEKQRELIQYIKQFWDIRSIRFLAKLEDEISALEKQIDKDIPEQL